MHKQMQITEWFCRESMLQKELSFLSLQLSYVSFASLQLSLQLKIYLFIYFFKFIQLLYMSIAKKFYLEVQEN